MTKDQNMVKYMTVLIIHNNYEKRDDGSFSNLNLSFDAGNFKNFRKFK